MGLRVMYADLMYAMVTTEKPETAHLNLAVVTNLL